MRRFLGCLLVLLLLACSPDKPRFQSIDLTGADAEASYTFNFYVTSNGSYIFKFYQGEDTNGQDVFLTIEVPVI